MKRNRNRATVIWMAVATSGLLTGAASAADLTLTLIRTDTNKSFPMTVTFQIVAELSDDGNEGMASIGLDLSAVKDAVAIDINDAGGANTQVTMGPDMGSCTPDQGICNPAGCEGTVIGFKLVQIGCAQNTIAFQGPVPPFPTGAVFKNLATFGNPLVVAEASMTLTTAPTAEYVITVDNGFGNTIDPGQGAGPVFSVSAIGSITNGQLTIPLVCIGDANSDDAIDAADTGFIQARFGCPTGVGDAGCDSADVNSDGSVDAADTGFVQARFGSPCPGGE